MPERNPTKPIMGLWKERYIHIPENARYNDDTAKKYKNGYGGPKSDMMTIIKIQSSQNSVWKIKNCNIHKVKITYSIHPK